MFKRKKNTTVNKPVTTKEEEPVHEVFPEVFSNSEFTSPADRLIEAIRQQYSRMQGVEVSREETLAVANKILESRYE